VLGPPGIDVGGAAGVTVAARPGLRGTDRLGRACIPLVLQPEDGGGPLGRGGLGEREAGGASGGAQLLGERGDLRRNRRRLTVQ